MNDPIPSARTPEEIAELERALDDSTEWMRKQEEDGGLSRQTEAELLEAISRNERLLNAA